MGGSSGFAAAGNHLVERAALGELRVEFPAEFAWPAGACVEAIDDGWINVFHENGSWEGQSRCPVCEAESHFYAPADSLIVWTTLLYYTARELTSPFMARPNFLFAG
jgi:hypothetical protein